MDFIHDVVFEDYFREVLAAVESRTLNYLDRGRDYYFSYRSLAECRIGNLRQRGRKFHGLDGGAGENIATHFRHRIFFTVVCDIVRDHDAASFEIRQKTLTHITEILNEKWGEGTVTHTITQQYRNMKEIIDTCPWLISLAEEACHSCGVTPLILPIRGGTDGAQLSFMGLPCPNLGTGGHAYHGPYEHITAEGMDAAVNVTLEIIRLFSQKKA